MSLGLQPARRENYRLRNWFGKALISVCVFALAGGGYSADSKHPIASPGNYELEPGLELTPFATEPAIVDPVAMTFDEEGRAYVVEMRDYPLGIGPDRRPGGTIRLLEDTDGDGKPERSTVFATGLRFPTSVAPWKGGIVVSAPPEILFLKDTDGDGKADVQEVLFTGFVLGVTDSNVNGLRWGLDNRWHGCNGGNGGSIVSKRRPGAPISIRNLDFSFDPDSGDFTPTFQTSGGFGLVFDDWGRSFVTYNINHIQHRTIPTSYLNRATGLPPVETTVSISDHEEASRIYPISDPETRVNHPEQSGHFSSAGGMGYISGPQWPAELRGSTLVCDVVGNLVHRDVISPDGPSFVARRATADQKREFFASRDPSFRPVGLYPGPDGALYLIDMQRDVIEHPDYIPQKVKDKIDLRAGEDRGRIYRITPKGGLPWRKPGLRAASSQQLIRGLADPNSWWRYTCQRLLVERQETAAVPQLKRLATLAPEPLARLHALWTLNGLHALEVSVVEQALTDPEGGVRENALMLSEQFLPSELLQQKIAGVTSDSSPRVRLQAALTLGQARDGGINAVLVSFLRRDCDNRWMRLAALSSLKGGAGQVLRALLSEPEFTTQLSMGRTNLVRELSDLSGGSVKSVSDPSLRLVLATTAAPGLAEGWRIAVLDGLQDGLGRAGLEAKSDPTLAAEFEKMSGDASPALLVAVWKAMRALGLPPGEKQRRALDRAKADVMDEQRTPTQRVQDIRLLGLGGFETVGPSLVALLEGVQPAEIQAAAIESLRSYTEPKLAEKLVDLWRSFAPTVRTAVLNLLLQRQTFHEPLVSAVENDRIKLGELNLDLEQRRTLLRESTPQVKARATKLLGDEEYSNRKGLVDEWLTKLPAAGDAQHGRAVFEKTCAQCHAVGSLGNHVGPELTDVSHRSVEDLASNILDPNMAINPGFVSYTATTDSGEIETGILQSESPEAVTLLQAQGKKVTIPRRKLKQLQSSGLSLMPEGLEAGMTPADLRDLIAFLQAKR